MSCCQYLSKPRTGSGSDYGRPSYGQGVYTRLRCLLQNQNGCCPGFHRPIDFGRLRARSTDLCLSSDFEPRSRFGSHFSNDQCASGDCAAEQLDASRRRLKWDDVLVADGCSADFGSRTGKQQAVPALDLPQNRGVSRFGRAGARPDIRQAHREIPVEIELPGKAVATWSRREDHLTRPMQRHDGLTLDLQPLAPAWIQYFHGGWIVSRRCRPGLCRQSWQAASLGATVLRNPPECTSERSCASALEGAGRVVCGTQSHRSRSPKCECFG